MAAAVAVVVEAVAEDLVTVEASVAVEVVAVAVEVRFSYRRLKSFEGGW